MTVEHPQPNDQAEPSAVDAVARMLGYQSIDHAFDDQRRKDQQRLLERAREQGGLYLFHQTTPDRARRVQTDGFKIAEAIDSPDDKDAICFAFAPERTVKQHLSAIRMLFDYLVLGQVVPTNPAHSVRGPKYVVTKGTTPVLDSHGEKWVFLSS